MNHNKKTFKYYFHCLIDSRLNQIFAKVSKDHTYKRHSERVIELHNTIAQLLGPERKELIAEYEDKSNSCTEIHQDNAYIVGLRDGMQLQRMLDKVI